MRVSVFMDVEDPINPLADDAALDFARQFNDVGIRGSFCITGEKCRVLQERGRTDVISSLAAHCLGLHTDMHSVHPTTMEMLADCNYEEGLRRAKLAEGRGKAKFEPAFGRSPSFWGGAGNTWSPEIAATLLDLKISAYAYALTSLPGGPVHRFNGALAFPQHLSISENAFIEGPNLQVLDEIERAGRAWTGLFVGHPTRFRHVAFWDAPYAGGRQPLHPEPTPEVPAEDYRRGMDHQRQLLLALKGRFDVVGLDEEIEKHRTWRPPTEAELDFFRAETAKMLQGAARWPIHRPDLDPSRIIEKTLALSDKVTVSA